MLGFVFKIILSRSISTEMLGVYTIALSIFLVFATALNSGLPVTISKFTASNLSKKNKNSISSLITSGLVISLVLSGIILAFIFLAKPLITNSAGNETVYLLLITMTPGILFTGIYAPIRGFLWGKENYYKVSLVEFLEQVLRIVSCVVLFAILDDASKVYATGISLSIACVLSSLLGVIFYFTSKGRLTLKQRYTKQILKSSTPISLVRFVGSMMHPLLTVLIPLQLVKVGYTKEQALSQLGIAMGMAMPLMFIPGTIIGALAMALIPKISTLLEVGKNKELTKQVNSAILFTLCCSFLVIPIFISVGQEITILLFNNATAGEYLKHGSWLVVSLCLAQLTSSILNSLGLEVKTFKYYIISSIVILIAIFTLPKYFGIYSLLYGMGLSGIIICVLSIIKINKTINNHNYHIINLVKLIAITIPTTLLCQFSSNLFSIFLPSIINIGLTSIIGVASFGTMLMVTNIITSDFIKSNFNNFKNLKLVKRLSKNIT